MQAGTIVASNYLAMAQVLGESFLEHHPDSTFSVLVVDDGDADVPEEFGIFRLCDLDIEPRDEWLMRTIYDVMEFSTSVKASFLRLLLASGPDAACYLDPDIEVFASFGHQVDAAMEHGIVLTPHVLQPVPRDGMKVDEETIMQSGMYNCGFLAVGPTARPFLDWWDQRLRFDALVDFGRARFTDQRWVDWVPSLFDYSIDRDPGMNVAWWNIHDRTISLDSGVPTVGGDPVKFVHFSGYDPLDRNLLSKHQVPRPRLAHEVGSGIRTLSDRYAERLVQLGHLERRRSPYQWSRSHDGVELTAEVRRLVRDAALDEIGRAGEVRTVPDAFDPDVDFAGWVEQRTGRTRAVTGTTTDSVASSQHVEITRIAPERDAGRDADETAVPAESPAAYDVLFDWSDAHGHAVRLILDHCSPGVVVDLGCGYAPHAEVLAAAGYEFIGLDLDATSLRRVAERGYITRQVDLGEPSRVDAAIGEALAELGSDAPVVAVLALDVLEHLVAPERLLAMLSGWSRAHDDPLLVTSVPNVAHRDIAAKLLAGRWDVTPTGLLDHTHLRFFTDRSITGVMASAGFTEAHRNDRIAPRSDQRWPAGAMTTSPHTPLAALVGSIRDLGDEHGDTYQLIRGYRAGERAGEPSLTVADASPHPVALSVIADPNAGDDDLLRLQAELEAQTSAEWELLIASAPSSGSAMQQRVATLDALVAAASGAYVAFVDRSEQVGPRWVAQFAKAMRVTVPGGALDADISGRVLRCELSNPAASPESVEEPGPASAVFAFPTAAVRSSAARFDGRRHQAVRIHAQLAPLCGVDATGERAVTADAATEAESAISGVVVDEPHVAAVLRQNEALRAEVDALRADNLRLVEHRERLERDNEWLNAELSAVPVRIVRRALRRDGSAD